MLRALRRPEVPTVLQLKDTWKIRLMRLAPKIAREARTPHFVNRAARFYRRV